MQNSGYPGYNEYNSGDFLSATMPHGNHLADFPGMPGDGMPTSIEDARTAKEWIYFVENKKKLAEVSKEEEKEKPKFADECVDYPRDPPRDSTKCCQSKLHDTMQKVKIDRKFLAVNKEAIVPLKIEEQLA